MRCPRCTSERIQRDYEDAYAPIRLAGFRRLLCNNCGLAFKGFDPLGKIHRAPVKKDSGSQRRRSHARYPAHLPATISLIEGGPRQGKVTYSKPSNGHCETICINGMGLSLVGSQFPEEELSRIGRLLFVRVNLPNATVEAVTSIVNHQRIGENRKRKWLLGVKIHQIADGDKANLVAYLEERAKDEPLLTSD